MGPQALVSRFQPRSLCSLVPLAVFSFCHRCNGGSFLLSSYLSRIGRIENLSCSACRYSSQDTSYFILHCPATHCLSSYFILHCPLISFCTVFAPLALWRLSGPGPRELPDFWGSVVFRHAPISWKGSGNNNNREQRYLPKLKCSQLRIHINKYKITTYRKRQILFLL